MEVNSNEAEQKKMKNLYHFDFHMTHLNLIYFYGYTNFNFLA